MLIDYNHVDICREGDTILHDVCLHIDEGEFVYLTGVVGSGKSSLLKTIYGELDIAAGQATVLGTDMRRVRRSRLPALRRQIGIVFQDFRLLTDRNVERNLDFVLRATGWRKADKRKERISQVLRQVGLADKLQCMPHQLSGGEQQRVCIARAILNSPRLILADEATGNQDAASGMHTAQILYELAQKGTAVVFATHNNALLHHLPGRALRCHDHHIEELPAADYAATAAAAAADECDDIPMATPVTANGQA